MKSKAILAAIAIFSILSGQSASAQTVVVSCDITQSNYTGSRIPYTRTFKIGDGEWLEWDRGRAQWYNDLCVQFHVFLSPKCSFSLGAFEASGSEGGVVGSIRIDRTTGALTQESENLLERNSVARRLSGICKAADEPTSPKTQF